MTRFYYYCDSSDPSYAAFRAEMQREHEEKGAGLLSENKAWDGGPFAGQVYALVFDPPESGRFTFTDEAGRQQAQSEHEYPVCVLQCHDAALQRSHGLPLVYRDGWAEPEPA